MKKRHKTRAKTFCRIKATEKNILDQLSKIYSNDYRRVSQHIKQSSNLPQSIKEIYNSLNDYKAFRRIADYYGRINRLKRAQEVNSVDSELISVSSSLDETRSYQSVSTTQSSQPIHTVDANAIDLPQPNILTREPLIAQMNKAQHFVDDDRITEQDEISENESSYRKKHLLLPVNNSHIETNRATTTSPTSKKLKHDLLSVRENIEKALSKLEHVMESKMNDHIPVISRESSQLIIRNGHFILNGHSHLKLDDIVRSLSNAVNQDPINPCSTIDEFPYLLANQNERCITQQNSITDVLERLNKLIDRGDFIHEKIEQFLSKLELS